MNLDQLAYIVVRSARIEQWRGFAENVLGTMVEDGPAGTLYLKYDEWLYRVLVEPAEDESFHAAGWSLRNKAAYDAARSTAVAAGVKVTDGSGQECAVRAVKEFFSFTDPAGTRQEVCWARTMSSTPFVSPAGVSRFVTGDLGMGHVVVPCHGDYDEAMAFYRDVMGLEYADYFERALTPGAPPVRAYFYHCANARQHSLALVETHNPLGLIHLMVEAATLDDVGRTIDRAKQHGAPIARSLGRHVNDSVVSFYLVSPSGFQIEYGFGSELMDWRHHEVRNISYGTYWGHEYQPGFGPANTRVSTETKAAS